MVSTLVEKAATLRSLGQLAAAKSTLAEAQSIADEKYDSNDRRRALLRAEAAREMLAAGRAADAEQELSAVVASLRQMDAPARLAEAVGSLGEAQLRNGHSDAALATLNESLAMWRKIVAPEHWSIADAQSRLGEALVANGKRQDGLKLMSDSLATLQAHRPKGDNVTLAATRRLKASTSAKSGCANPCPETSPASAGTASSAIASSAR